MKNTKTLAAALILTSIVGGTAATIVKAQSPQTTPTNVISEAQAKDIALKAYSGNGKFMEIELEDEKGKWLYDVAFEEGNQEVEVMIDATSGKVIDQKTEAKDADSDDDAEEANEAPETAESEAAESARLAPLATITAPQAKTTALANHSGNINNVVLEDEDGTIVYGLEYANGDEVKVDATTGAVVKVEMAGEEDKDQDHLPREEEEIEEIEETD